jgi:hypothetical protein
MLKNIRFQDFIDSSIDLTGAVRGVSDQNRRAKEEMCVFVVSISGFVGAKPQLHAVVNLLMA